MTNPQEQTEPSVYKSERTGSEVEDRLQTTCWWTPGSEAELNQPPDTAMKLSYRLKRVCGSVFSNGNVLFTPDGNTILSPVGNRITLFDLVQHTCTTLPFESRKNIKKICLSNSGRFLIVVDVENHALFINFERRVLLQRLNFKKKVYDIRFSPDDSLFAVSYGQGCQIWQSPSIRRDFAPLVLKRTIAGHFDDVTCLDWSSDSESLIMGSKDLHCKIYYRVKTKFMAMTQLSGHRDVVVGVYFSKDDGEAFSVARDGGAFTWRFEEGERQVVEKKGRGRRGAGDSSDDSEAEESAEEGCAEEGHRSRRGGRWVLAAREFLWDPHSQVKSTAFNRASGLLVVGFSTGVFSLYEMPGCVNIQRLSVSHSSLSTICINNTGEWIGMGSSRLGQLLVWEWQSESYVLKQQGHLYGLNTLDISSDGQYIATGGEDSKVKLWNSFSGFCFITFSEHIAPVTGVKFAGKGNGKAIISSSLDGTIRAHDLLRYKNFRTLTTPTPAQLTTLAVDASGEVVCAGSLDPFSIYTWSLQSGHLLDVLSGHEGPIACMHFADGSSTLATGSWDGTLKLWDVYESRCIETFEHGCDVLATAFRPDGKEICTAATNGNLYFWDVETGQQTGIIDGRRDISGGRFSTDARTADNSTRSKHFTTVTYSADGSCVIAAGHSKYACIYVVATKTLVKKFQLSHNRSLEGVVDELRSDRLADGVSLDALGVADSDDEHLAASTAPGATNGASEGSRITRPDIVTTAIRFSPSGRDWAAATSQGLQVFSLDENMLFAPTDLDVAITPQAVSRAILNEDFTLAVNMALHLGEKGVLKRAVDAVPTDALDLVVKTLDPRLLRDLLRFLAEEIVQSRHVEYYLMWCSQLLLVHGAVLQSDSMPHQESLRALIRALTVHEKEIMRACDQNQFSLSYLVSQLAQSSVAAAGRGDGEAAAGDAGAKRTKRSQKQ